MANKLHACSADQKMSYLDFADKYRDYETSDIVFVTTNTHDKIPIFWDDEKARVVYEALKFLVKRGDLKLYAWVIMPNHLHLLFEASKGKNYSQVMHDLKSYSAKRISDMMRDDFVPTGEASRPRQDPYWRQIIRQSPGRGTEASPKKEGSKNTTYKIWQKSFFVRLPQKPESFGLFYDYIHYNPVKHNLADDLRDWRWSSYRAACKKGYYDDLN